jgi:hypothetical protein
MFGKAEWFRLKTVGWGLRPVVWQGWMYSAAWMGVIGGPFISLVLRHQAAEALVWLAASLGLLGWEVRGIRRELRSSDNNGLLYIGDDGACSRLG